MKIKKICLDPMERCYCASHLTIDGKKKAVLASEAIGGPCYAYSGDNFEIKEVVWQAGGGTMSFVEIPHRNGEFLAVQNFFPGFQSEQAKIVWGRYQDGKWHLQDFLSLPFVHRFDLLEANGRIFFIGATLCTSKKDRNDWADPGKIFVGELPEDLNQPMAIKPIQDFLLKNHGYWRGKYEGKQAGYVTCDSGVYVVIPPEGAGDWQIKQIIAGQISDIAVFDLDQDGNDELALFSPFHGDCLEIRKKVDERRYEQVYQYPNPSEFAHALWAGNVLGKPMVIFGFRKGNKELGYITYDKNTGQYETHIIEEGVGPANVSVMQEADRAVLIAANHTKNESAVYILTLE